jgi:hypothetical protein
MKKRHTTHNPSIGKLKDQVLSKVAPTDMNMMEPLSVTIKPEPEH